MNVTGSPRFNAAVASLKKLTCHGDDYKLRDAVIDEVDALQAENEALRERVRFVIDGCDRLIDGVQADNARLRAALVDARWRVHHEICGTVGYDAAGNWREGETHEKDCDAITEALK